MPVSAAGRVGSGPLNPLSEDKSGSKISGFDEGEEAIKSGSERRPGSFGSEMRARQARDKAVSIQIQMKAEIRERQ